MLALSFWTIAICIAATVFSIYVMVRICHIANDTSKIVNLLSDINDKLSKNDTEPETVKEETEPDAENAAENTETNEHPEPSKSSVAKTIGFALLAVAIVLILTLAI
jgi:hypothetical protein